MFILFHSYNSEKIAGTVENIQKPAKLTNISRDCGKDLRIMKDSSNQLIV